jgi:Gas vesicle protein
MADLPQGPQTGALARQPAQASLAAPAEGANLGDILLRVLDQGIVIAGDIQINLLDIELLTIKLRLLVASVDTAREMGINWWESDPTLKAAEPDQDGRALADRVARLERQLEAGREPDEEADG